MRRTGQTNNTICCQYFLIKRGFIFLYWNIHNFHNTHNPYYSLCCPIYAPANLIALVKLKTSLTQSIEKIIISEQREGDTIFPKLTVTLRWMKEVALQLDDLNIIIVYVETCINNICWKKGTNSLILRRWRGMMDGGEGWLSISWLFLPTARKFTTGLSLSLSLLYTGRSTPIHLLNSLFSLKNHINRFRWYIFTNQLLYYTLRSYNT